MPRELTEDEKKRIEKIERRNEVARREILARKAQKMRATSSDEGSLEPKENLEGKENKNETEAYDNDINRIFNQKEEKQLPIEVIKFRDKHPRIASLPLIGKLIERIADRKISREEIFLTDLIDVIDKEKREEELYKDDLNEFYNYGKSDEHNKFVGKYRIEYIKSQDFLAEDSKSEDSNEDKEL